MAAVFDSAAMLSAVALYMTSSAGMTIVNKLTVRALPLPITLTIVQMAFTVACLIVMPSFRKLVKFGNARDAWRWARAIPILFAIMLASSMLALRHASMGAVVVVRSIAPLPTLAVEALAGEKVQVDTATVLSLLLGVSGVLLYSRHDIQFSPVGLMWLSVNTVTAVVERLLQRHMMAVEPIDVSKQGMMLLNNGVGVILMLPLVWAFGEGARLRAVVSTVDTRAVALLLLSCVNGMAISYAGLNVQKYLTATAMLVLNNSNKFAVVAFGIFVLGEASSPQAVVGCTVALGAGLIYAHARQQLSKRVAAAAEAAKGQPGRDEQQLGVVGAVEGSALSGEQAEGSVMAKVLKVDWKLGVQAVAVIVLFAAALRPIDHHATSARPLRGVPSSVELSARGANKSSAAAPTTATTTKLILHSDEHTHTHSTHNHTHTHTTHNHTHTHTSTHTHTHSSQPHPTSTKSAVAPPAPKPATSKASTPKTDGAVSKSDTKLAVRQPTSVPAATKAESRPAAPKPATPKTDSKAAAPKPTSIKPASGGGAPKPTATSEHSTHRNHSAHSSAKHTVHARL